MQLLVSVASVDDARAALDGGADIIDAKDPARGALGAVSREVLRAIAGTVGGTRLLTAALGDADDIAAVECAAHVFAVAGAGLVKLGLAGTTDSARAAAFLSAAVRGAGGAGARVVAVAYADAGPASLSPAAILGLATGAGAAGLLIDTINKKGPGLRATVAPDTLAALVKAAHDEGLFVALAGRLTAADLPFARDAGADVAGVRGAACDGGRAGRVLADRVRQLRELCG